ncbi:histidine kinase [Thermomonospora curvata DSM 43183]|uniref:histidine kinase n=1 Tax=Thermomonospora curvata (strain ATCC 19995 / DSM 43183 / JCM 3096 / KCTC 9072 / NBRC 15933 / NCIMB 10081 / Henssen B9) TaxID=471852 RepID=D1A744_THECD|nr:histidine kinase [Thermomonospora curvata DSM 43183]PKK12126.1 MAG: sensor histidine kinase [Thermomonospora sp. CIF 1]
MDGGAGVIERSGAAVVRGLALYLMALVIGVLLCCVMLMSITLIGVGAGLVLVPPAGAAVRRYADRYRELTGRWTGTRIDSPYAPAPEPRAGLAGWWDRTVHTLSDQATWRDLLWLLVDPITGVVTALLPAALVAEGIYGVLLASGLWMPIYEVTGTEWFTFVPVGDWRTAVAAGALGALYIGAGLWIARPMLALHGRWAARLLAPTAKSRLARRVQQLARTRSEAVDAQAAELRRIERDLHDGAQARLVAMGMSLGAIEHLLDRDPQRARQLLAEVRRNSVQALNELRDLVRGIHPPVLADRGLVDAVRALALDHPLPVEVSADLDGRPAAPVESAVYFAVAEVLTNAAKHSGAQRVWVDIRHCDGTLRVTVTDDGHGGADPSGSGLRGIERRIATFDGVLAVSSPPGGPTIVTMELPCASSSPKTSHS